MEVYFFLECETLIRHMLLIDPERRLSMREIIAHKWMRLGGDEEEFERLIENSLSNRDNENQVLNEMVVQHMESLNFERDQTIEVCEFYLSGHLLYETLQ